MRLPQYLRVLAHLREQGIQVVSSQQLGRLLQVTPAQIRKDLSYFGRFGKQGRGYSVEYLLKELQSILHLDHEWHVGVVGVGRLGRAILGYPGFTPQGFKIVAAFDAAPRLVGQIVAGIMVQPMHRLKDILHTEGIRICVVAVPGSVAQKVIDELVNCGVQAIVNYAPIAAQAPAHVKLRSIDPVLAMQSMTYYLNEPSGSSSNPKARKQGKPGTGS